jgi:hypothetical protein
MVRNFAIAAVAISEAIRDFEKTGRLTFESDNLEWSGLKPAAYIHSVRIVGGPRNVQSREILSLNAVDTKLISPEKTDDSVVFKGTQRLYSEKDIVEFLRELSAYLEVSGMLSEVLNG